MNGTPAAELARLRATYGAAWRIGRQAAIAESASGPGGGAVRWTAAARDGSRTLTADTAAGLENAIIRHTGGS